MRYVWIVVDYDGWEFPIYYGAFLSQEAAESHAVEMSASVERMELIG